MVKVCGVRAAAFSQIVIPSNARDLHFAANCRSLALLGMTQSERIENRRAHSHFKNGPLGVQNQWCSRPGARRPLSAERNDCAPGDDERAADQNGERGGLAESDSRYDLRQHKKKHDVDANQFAKIPARGVDD